MAELLDIPDFDDPLLGDPLRDPSGVVGAAPAAPPPTTPSSSLMYRLIAIADNERHAPELLPFPGDLIGEALTAVAAQQALVEEMRAAPTPEAVAHLPFRPADILAADAQRVQHAATEIIRVRVAKLQRLAHAISAMEEAFAPLLSSNELQLARRLASISHAAMLGNGLQQLPPALQSVVPNYPAAEGPELLPTMDSMRYVLVLALEKLRVQLPGLQQPQELTAGDYWVAPFEVVRQFITGGQMRLV